MMNRFEPNAYGRNDFGGSNDYGLFGGYPTAQMAPPSAVPAPFSSGPPPPSLMSLSAVPPLLPPPSVPAPLPIPTHANLPPPSMVPQQQNFQGGPPMGPGSAIGQGSAGMSTTGVNTNSRHPLAVKARVFIGNLNTNAVTRDEFEQLYRRFGDVLAVSMHRGYGFVQYQNEYEARNAISFTDGMVLGGQRLDVNLASEPKVGREAKAMKRQADSTPAETTNKRPRPNADGKTPGSASTAVPKPLFPTTKSSSNVEVNTNATTTTGTTTTKAAPAKTITTTAPTKPASSNIAVLTKKTESTPTKVQPATVSKANINITPMVKSEVNGGVGKIPIHCNPAPGATDTSPDVLICGQCRSLFNHISEFTAHRKENGTGCNITPKPTDVPKASEKDTPTAIPTTTKAEGEPETLLCYVCQKSFDHAWNLVAHIGKDHGIVLYHTSKPLVEGTDKLDASKEKTLLSAINAAKEAAKTENAAEEEAKKE